MAKDKVVVDIITNSEKSQKSILKYAAGVTAAVAAVAGMVKISKELMGAYAAQEQAEVQLQSALKATHGAVGISKTALADYAKELSNSTGIADEAIINAEALMTTFTQVGRDAFPIAVEAAADMSKMFGQELQGSVIQLGTALNSPIAGIGRLRRIGISFTEAQKEMIKGFMDQNDIASAQKVILDELHNEFGGIAKELGGSVLGSYDKLKNSVTSLKEELGKSVAEGLEPFAKATTNLLSNLTTWIATNKKLKAFFDDTDKGAKDTSYSIDDLNEMLSALEQKQSDMGDLDLGIGEQIDAIKNLIDAYSMQDTFLIKIREEKLAIARQSKEEADAEQKRQEAYLADLEALKTAYASTKEGQIAAVEEQIKYFEEFKKGPMAVAVLESLREQLEALQGDQEELTTTTQAFLGEALVPLSDEAATMWQNYGEGIADAITDTEEAQEKVNKLNDTFKAFADNAGSIYSDTFSLVSQLLDNELQETINTEDEKINAIEQTYDDRLALLDEDSEAYKNLEREKVEAVKNAENSKNDLIADAKRKQWKMDKGFAITKSIMDTISAVTEALPNIPLSAVIGALGAANTAAIAAQPMPAFATGGSFTTTGPTPILVGDNASGNERVTVEPIGGSSGSPQTMIVSIDGQQFTAWVQDKLDNGGLRIPRRVLV